MSIALELEKDIVNALKQGGKQRAEVLRSLKAAIKNELIAKKLSTADDQLVLTVLKREIKRRKEAIEMYKQGERDDLVKKEQVELVILEEYLPPMLSTEELKEMVEKIFNSLSEEEKDFGRVMKMVMAEVAGRADGKVVAELVKSKFN